MIPSLFPIFDAGTGQLQDGSFVHVSAFCQKAISSKAECRAHYDALKTKSEDYYQCPFGMTSRNFYYGGELKIITGVVAFPRFNSADEQRMAKKFPAIRVARSAIEGSIAFFRETEKLRAAAVQEASQVLPQAFHELRKLNAAVLQHAEKELRDTKETRSLLSIKSAAELMRNNFDILEALSNIEGMKALPSEPSINLFDLVYKTKRVYEERATARHMLIHVDGVRAIVSGSQKSFPIVPCVLIENAIKYGKPRTSIEANIATIGNKAILAVENETDAFIDCARCFEKGVRYSSNVEGGGFGLYLAKEIVTIHRGTITCKYGSGKVRMIVELPLVNVIAHQQ